MTVMRYKRRGSIAVFLAALLSVILMFVNVLLDNMRRYVTKYEIAIAADAAIRSCFAEYNKILYDRFHLMYIDPTYKGIADADAKTIEHLIWYMNENMGGHFQDIYVSDASLNNVKKAMDNGGENIINQIIAYEEKLCGDSISNCSTHAIINMYIKEILGNDEFPSSDYVRRGEIEYLIYGLEDDYLSIDKSRKSYEDELSTRFELGLQDDYSSYDSEVYEHMYPYETYLYEQLEGLDVDVIIERLGDIVCEFVRNEGSPECSIENCIYGFDMEVVVVNGDGDSFLISKEYEY